MKIRNYILGIIGSAALAALLLSSCVSEDQTDDIIAQQAKMSINVNGTSSGLTDLGVLTAFTVDLESSDYKDVDTASRNAFSNANAGLGFSEKHITRISFNDTAAPTIDDLAGGDSFIVYGNSVRFFAHSEGLTLLVSGRSRAGRLVLYSDQTFQLRLNGVNMQQSDSASVDVCQGDCLLSLSGDNRLHGGVKAQEDLWIRGNGRLMAAAPVALDCVGDCTVSNGELFLKSSVDGGRALACGKDLTLKGGELYALTEGGNLGSVSPVCIESQGRMEIIDGKIYTRNDGTSGEGIHSHGTCTVQGGKVAALSMNDAILSDREFRIKGGKMLGLSDGDGSGIVCREALYAEDGVLMGIASNKGQHEGFSLGGTLHVTYGTVIGLGCKGGDHYRIDGQYVVSGFNGEVGEYVSLICDNKPRVTFMLPRNYQNGHLFLSVPHVCCGNYPLHIGVTPTGGTPWLLYYTAPTSVTGGRPTGVTMDAERS